MTEEHDDLAKAFTRVAGIFHPAESVQETLDRVAELAVDLVDGCDSASVSLARDGTMTTTATSGELAVRVDDLQRETGEGPCLEAVKEPAAAVYAADLASDERFPVFGPRAARRGVGSLLSHKIAADGTIGALNMYAAGARAYSEADREAAYLFAIFAAVVMAFAERRLQANQLREALESRDVIGQAKGILMEREKVTADEAFEMLRRASQRVNRKLRDLAQEMTETGEEPTALF